MSTPEVMSPCSAALAPVSKHGQEVIITGTLIFDYHSAYLAQPGIDARKLPCAIFTVFPGTPAFLTPGFSEEHRVNPKMDSFVPQYKKYIDQNPTAPRTVRIQGILNIAPDKRPGTQTKGFGWRGTFRTAIVVNDVAEIANDRR